MPENTAYFRVACDLNMNNNMFELYRTDITNVDKQ